MFVIEPPTLKHTQEDTRIFDRANGVYSPTRSCQATAHEYHLPDLHLQTTVIIQWQLCTRDVSNLHRTTITRDAAGGVTPRFLHRHAVNDWLIGGKEKDAAIRTPTRRLRTKRQLP